MIRKEKTFEEILRLRINGRFLESPNPTGVQRWANEVLHELKRSTAVELQILKPPPLFKSGIRGHIWEQMILPILGNRRYPLISLANWGPYFTRNQLLVVHDLIPIKNPWLFNKYYALVCKFLFPRIIHRSKIICTPSMETSTDLSMLLGVSAEKIRIVGAGTRFTESPFLEKNKSFLLNSKYFIFLGGFNARKNLSFLLSIWNQRKNQNIKLVVVTRSTERVTTQADITGLDDSIEIINDPDDDLLISLYRNSIALLFPSVTEGFGLPLLEVMSVGKPFISNQVGAARELSLGDSKVIDLNGKAWLREINRLSSQGTLCDRNQIALAKEYNWERVVKLLIESIRVL